MKRAVLAILCGALLGGANMSLADSNEPSPSPSLAPSATPTPAPQCSVEDAALYSACVASCDAAASSICSGQGHIDGFVAFITAGLDACSIPGIDQRREYNGLKGTIQGLRESGIISKAASQILRKKADACRKKLEVKNHSGNHGRGHK